MTDAVTSNFADRHIGPDTAGLNRILDVVGVDSLDALATAAVPAAILDDRADNVPTGLDVLDAPRSEHDVLAELKALASQNTVRRR